MNKYKMTLIAAAAAFLVGGCNIISKGGDASADIKQTVTAENRLDKAVSIPEDTQFKTMDKAEKEKLYAELDKIEKFSQDTKSPISYSNIEEITSDAEYTDFILNSQKNASIIYLGFDECPYCKAFTPKLSHLAKEYGVKVYYYNTRKRDNDANFKSIVSMYNVETVPHAFIVKNGDVVNKINHEHSMTAIEAFVKKVADSNK
ncbi:thioredoxin family protein [Tuanshanicoccus lijuaniae]|uniref:thioredoxin family protein n=1 Tax=Aerococcaceae bacterium zg-1292 TaxID=2774330 RepID=UPI0019378946|nr:thioredoxin family protein [Aerococcaceae bacterium zg-1292]MBF6625032.1 thioredoxin family protein [Aerococcaceae bacterium zg-BR9]MBF6626299.1 thioredoxin family protein [Aerococcaceae bacterium zg-BR9]QQA37562.1 thioredoxin family protein [Aerococcaceae bacterium zg-1292]